MDWEGRKEDIDIVVKSLNKQFQFLLFVCFVFCFFSLYVYFFDLISHNNTGDFGGQVIYITTHTMLIGEDTLVVFCCDISLPLDTIKQQAQDWLTAVWSVSRKCDISVVLTHSDQIETQQQLQHKANEVITFIEDLHNLYCRITTTTTPQVIKHQLVYSIKINTHFRLSSCLIEYKPTHSFSLSLLTSKLI